MKLVDPGSAEDADFLLDRPDFHVGDMGAGIGDQDQHAAGIQPERLASGDRQRIEAALRNVAPTDSDQVGADLFPKDAVILGKDLSIDAEQLGARSSGLGAANPNGFGLDARAGGGPVVGPISWLTSPSGGHETP